MNSFLSDGEFALYLAQDAGQILLSLQKSGEYNGDELGTAGDSLANKFLVSEIAKNRPNDAILSEEETDNGTRLQASRVWIIDPLDGTREFSQNRADWAVHVALVIDGKPLVGAVALPSLGLDYSSENVKPLAQANSPLKLTLSRNRPPKEAIKVAAKLGAELLPMGSAGAKAMAVVRGVADIYVHAGGQYEWDNCAPVAVAKAYGLWVSRLDGRELSYNQKDIYSPDLVICRPELAQMVLRTLIEVSS